MKQTRKINQKCPTNMAPLKLVKLPFFSSVLGSTTLSSGLKTTILGLHLVGETSVGVSTSKKWRKTHQYWVTKPTHKCVTSEKTKQNYI